MNDMVRTIEAIRAELRVQFALLDLKLAIMQVERNRQ